MSLVSTAQHSIYEMITKDRTKYKELLKKLIVKSLIDLFEEKVIVRCLQRDAGLVREVLSECKSTYENLLKSQLGL